MDLGYWLIPLAMIGGAIRVSVPFLFVSLGECITEKSGRINLGHEASLITGAMTGYGASLISGSAWVGVLAAGIFGSFYGLFHGWICGKKGVNDIAMGIALMMFGTGLAFFFGKPLIKPTAPRLDDFSLAWWSSIPQVVQAFKVNTLFIIGILLAFVLEISFRKSRWGMILRIAGESAEAGNALGYNINKVRIIATAAGSFLSGIAGAYLSLFYPGSWNEGLSSGQGLMAVALVIFAKWNPKKCLWTSLLFGGAGAIGPALQSAGYSSGYYIFNALPYILTLIIIVSGASNKGNSQVPAELNIIK
jgi:simple sugar transport system permease protein